MILVITICIIAAAVALFIFNKKKSSEPQKTIYKVNYTITSKKLPSKPIYQVNFIHNKDFIPVERKSYIRNYVI